uniref:Polycystin family receptor for egg jelly n=1 Tax=Leptobrachium leishanense TaxID=445787 RepID=A0A8C5N031_9ANUR
MFLAFSGPLWAAIVVVSLAQPMKPPPLNISCSDSVEKVYTRQDTDSQSTCLWRTDLQLLYRPSVTLLTNERQGDPPFCSWYGNGLWFKNTTQWSGQETLGIPARGVITVQCITSWCLAPTCLQQDMAVLVADQDTEFFVMSPQGLIHQYEIVLFGWCAKMKSTNWTYSFSSRKGAQSILIPSTYHVEVEDIVYPTGLRLNCSSYYNYNVNMSYGEAGQYVATLVIPSGPVKELTISVVVEQSLLHVFTATSNHFNQTIDMRLAWTLLPLSSKVMHFQFVDHYGSATWDLAINNDTAKMEFCSPPPISANGYPIIYLRLLVNQSTVRQLIGQFDFINGIVGLSTPKNLGYMSLNRKETQKNIYYFSQKSGLYYSAKERDVEAGSSTDLVFLQQETLNFLFQIKLVKPKSFSLVAHVYLNKTNSLYTTLSDTDIEVHLLSSGSTPIFTAIYIVWFIPLQHRSLQCEWTFTLELYGSRKAYLFRNTTYTYENSVIDAASFIPNAKLGFQAKFYAGFVAEANFTKSGLKPVVLKTNFGTYASKVLETSIYCYKMPCDIFVFGIKKPKSQPFIRTTKGSHLSVFVSMQIKCPASQAINLMWKIYWVPDQYAVPEWDNYLHLPQVSPVNQSNLEIPKFTLSYGFYLLNVSIDIATSDDEDAYRSNSDSVLVAVQENELRAAISGGSYRTVGFSESWILNGASSSDPDSPDPSKGLTFTWYCTINISDYISMKISENATCHPDQTRLVWINPGAAVQIIMPEFLQGNKRYYFRLVVGKGNKTSYFDQTVFVVPGIPPLISVTCIENCRQMLIPTERFALSGKCLDCSKSSRLHYEWSLYQGTTEIKLDWESKTSTGRHIAYLSIVAKTFVDIAEQWYTIELKVTTWTGAPSVYKYLFYVNFPPKPGMCEVKPSVGSALQTLFTVHCSGFSDQNLPLTYKIIASLDKKANMSSLRENVLGTIVYFGYEPDMPPSLLPVGISSEGYSLPLYVQVYDSLQSYTQMVLYATVTDYKQGKPVETVLDKLKSLTSGSSSPLNIFLETGDFIKAGHLVQTIASVLNHRFDNFVHLLGEERRHLREMLLNMTSTIRISNTMGINQIITCISDLTTIAEETTVKSQQLAVGKLMEATDSLLKYRKESLGSVESERLSGGILMSLSNVMSSSLLSIYKTDMNVMPDVVEVLQSSLSAVETATDVVSQGKVPGESETSMETQLFKISLNKAEKWDLVDSTLKKRDCLSCFYPTLQNKSSVLPIDAVVTSAFYEFKEDPLPWLTNRIGINTSVTAYYMAAPINNERVIDVIPETVDIILERNAKIPLFDIFVSPDKDRTTSGLFSFEIDLDSNAEWYIQFFYTQDIVFNISIHIGVNVKDNPPVASFQIPSAEKLGSQKNFLRDWNPKMIRVPTESLSKTLPTLNLSVEMTTSYAVWKKVALLKASIYNVACLDFEEGNNWSEASCQVGPLTNNERVHCVCKGLQKPQSRKRTALKKKHTFFAAKIFVVPNPIDLTKVTFRELGNNFVILLTVLCILILSAPLMAKARKLDKRDALRKQRVLALADNDPYDTERYIVTLYTGSRYGAGTTAEVFLKIIGMESDSETHLLSRPGRDAFETGGVDTFLLSTSCCLGDISHIRIWHNNSGKSPGWYLSRIKIENVFTKQVWYFICRRWLDVNKEDGLIERRFSPTDRSVPLKKMDFFLIDTSWTILEEHLWISIFASFIPSSLSRVQRLACGIVVLLCNLLVNIAFFSIPSSEDQDLDTTLIRSIVVGVESSLITLPLEWLVYSLFSYANASKVSRGQQTPTEDELRNTTMQTTYKEQSTAWQGRLKDLCLDTRHYEKDLSKDEEPSMSGLDSRSSTILNVSTSATLQGMQNNCVMPEALANQIVSTKAPPPSTMVSKMIRPQFFIDQNTKFRLILHRTCPCISRWSMHLAWSTAFLLSTVSSCLIIVYGLSYGYRKSMLWMIASVTSFVQGVFISQLGKITFKTAYSSYFTKYPADVPWIRDSGSLENLEVSSMREDAKRELQSKVVLLRKTEQYQPLSSDKIALIRKMNMRKAKVWVFVKNLVSHFMFLFLVLYLEFSRDNVNIFHYNQAIYTQFSRNLKNVDRFNQTYAWLSDVFAPLIHNKERPTFLAESWSHIIGLPRIRRVKTSHCPRSGDTVHSLLNRQCYTQQPKNDRQVKPNTRNTNFDPDRYDGFTFEDRLPHWNQSLPGTFFGVQGYTVYFFPEKDLTHSLEKIQVLKSANWLNGDTWALVVEMSTFNPDVHLFCAISAVFEVSHVGRLNPVLHVRSFRLLTFQDLGHVDICFISFFCVFLLVSVVDEILTVCAQKKKYFRRSNGVTLVLKSLLFFVFILTITKLVVASKLLDFYSLYPRQFIPLFTAVHVDVIYKGTLGFLAFCVALKSLRYACFLYDIRLAQKSIMSSLSEICSMALLYTICVATYSSFGYLVFGQFEWDFSSFLNSARTVFSYSLSNFQKNAFPSNLDLGGLYLFSFFFVMVCVVVNLFQAVILLAYKDTKQSVYEEPSEEADTVSFLIFKVKAWWALSRRRQPEEYEHDSLNGLLYGRSQKHNKNPLGLKVVRFGEKNLVVLSE